MEDTLLLDELELLAGGGLDEPPPQALSSTKAEAASK